MQPTARLRAIHRIRVRLERQGFPRLQMLLIVLLTAASGFLASYGLLRGGMTEMWLRYLVAFAIAYVVFLGLLWLAGAMVSPLETLVLAFGTSIAAVFAYRIASWREERHTVRRA